METSTASRPYAIDVSRVGGRTEATRDWEAPDAIWVPVVSHTRDDCISPEAKSDAIRFVTELGLGVGGGIDKTHGPEADHGQGPPISSMNDSVNSAFTSEAEYLRQAAVQKVASHERNPRGFVTFYRVRRPDVG